MAAVSTTYLSGLLKRTALFSDAEINSLLEATQNGEPRASITQIVAEKGYTNEAAFLEAIAKVLHLSFVKLDDRPAQEVLDRLPTKAIFQYNVIPVSEDNGTLVVASSDPLNVGLLDALRLVAGMRVKLALSTSADIAKAEKRFYGIGAETVAGMQADKRFEIVADDGLGKVDISELGQEASIVKFVSQIIREATAQQATDIHFEPMEESLRIRYRVDGVLHEADMPPQLHRFQAAIISRIKVMANMDIAEKRLPMDGRIGLQIEGSEIDIRVSTMPTVYGESVSLRLLRGSGEFIGLVELGMSKRDSSLISKVIQRPNGIVLVTGPTGSGKSTSLYAYLHEINTPDRRILTAEEPIEYEMAGVNQVLVRPDIGLNFALVLRHFLRQDPDIIMVGEIRDKETADIAIQAALTGHLVFSTLHTNDSAGAFTRLLDMKVEPYLVASVVEAVVAQRLVRRLCPECMRPAECEESFLREIEFPIERLGEGQIMDHGACEKCRMTGFHGRGGIFETLQMSEAIRSLIITRSSAGEIKQSSVQDGMSTLRDDGWAKVLKGFTTVDEVLRVTEEND